MVLEAIRRRPGPILERDPGTGVLCLRDLLPLIIRTAHVLSFGYEASASAFFGEILPARRERPYISDIPKFRLQNSCDNRILRVHTLL